MIFQLQVLDVAVNTQIEDYVVSIWGIIAIWELPTNTSRKQKNICSTYCTVDSDCLEWHFTRIHHQGV